MNTENHLKLTGCSNTSWKDAVVQTITEASNTIKKLSSVTIIEQRAKINEDKITEYYVDLDLGFIIDQDEKTN